MTETVTGPAPLEAAVRWRRQAKDGGVERVCRMRGWAAAVNTQPLRLRQGRETVRQRHMKEFAGEEMWGEAIQGRRNSVCGEIQRPEGPCYVQLGDAL